MKTINQIAGSNTGRICKNIRRNTGSGLKILGRDIWHDRISYLFLLPFALVFITFTVIPVVTAIFYSFTYYNILEDPQWIGWKNYIRLFLSDDIFRWH